MLPITMGVLCDPHISTMKEEIIRYSRIVFSTWRKPILCRYNRRPWNHNGSADERVNRIVLPSGLLA